MGERPPTGQTPPNPYSNPSIVERNVYGRSGNLSKKASAKLKLKVGVRYLNALPPDYPKAVSWLEDAIFDDPKLTEAYIHLGLTYNSQGLFDKAKDAYSKAFFLKEKSVDALNGLGATHFNLKDYNSAIEFYNKTLTVDSKNLVANLMTANSYFMLKNFEAAVAAYQKALQIDEKSVEANYNLALCYLKLNNPNAAKKQYEILEKLNKPLSDNLENLINQKAAVSVENKLP